MGFFFCRCINVDWLHIILSIVHYINLQKTPFFVDFLPNLCQNGGFHGNGSTNRKIFVLGDYTQTVKVSSKSMTMRAHPCLVLTENRSGNRKMQMFIFSYFQKVPEFFVNCFIINNSIVFVPLICCLVAFYTNILAWCFKNLHK